MIVVYMGNDKINKYSLHCSMKGSIKNYLVLSSEFL